MILLRKFNLLLLLLLPLASFFGNAMPDIIVSVIAICFVIECAAKSDWKAFNHLWFKLILVFWVLLCCSSIIAANQLAALKNALPFIRFPIFAVAVYSIISSAKGVKRMLLFSMCISVILISINTLFQFAFQFDIFGNVIDYAHYPRLKAPSGKLAPGIMLSFFVLPLVASAIFYKGESKYKIAATLGVIAIFLSGERTAFVTTIIGCAIVFFASKSGRKLILPLIMLMLIFSLALYQLKQDVIKRQVISTYETLMGFGEDSYGIIASSALSIFNDHKVFGIGAKQLKFYCAEHVQKISPRHTDYYCGKISHPHNIFLEVLIDTGFIGFSIFICFLLSIFGLIILNIKKIIADPLLLGAATHICVKLIPLAPISSFYYAWSMMPFWMMLGIISLARKK